MDVGTKNIRQSLQDFFDGIVAHDIFTPAEAAGHTKKIASRVASSAQDAAH